MAIWKKRKQKRSQGKDAGGDREAETADGKILHERDVIRVATREMVDEEPREQAVSNMEKENKLQKEED